jgi:hypothetical protein
MTNMFTSFWRSSIFKPVTRFIDKYDHVIFPYMSDNHKSSSQSDLKNEAKLDHIPLSPKPSKPADAKTGVVALPGDTEEVLSSYSFNCGNGVTVTHAVDCSKTKSLISLRVRCGKDMFTDVAIDCNDSA